MKVIWAEAARRDLADFAEQAYRTDPDRADRLLAEAERVTLFLAQVPYGGSPQEDNGIRKYRFGRLPFVVLYAVENGTVNITRLHHSSQDWRK